MNDWYNIGIIPGLVGDLIGTGNEDPVLDGYNGDSNYQYEQTRPIKGGDGNPLASEIPDDVIEVEDNGTIYVFDSNGIYVTEYPASAYSNANTSSNNTSSNANTTQRTDVVEIEDNGTIYVFDANGIIIDSYPASEKSGNTGNNGILLYPTDNNNTSSSNNTTQRTDVVEIEDNGTIYVFDANGIIIDSYPASEKNGNTGNNGILLYPTDNNNSSNNYNDDDDDDGYYVPTSAPMTDAAGNTFYVDSNGNYVDSDGDPYEPVLEQPPVEVYYDELGNLRDSDGNILEPAPGDNSGESPSTVQPDNGYTDELGNSIPGLNDGTSSNGSTDNNQSNNGSSNNGYTDELGNSIPGLNDGTSSNGSTNNNQSNNGSSNNNTSNNSGFVDELGEPIPGLNDGDNVINEPPELDSEDEENYIPTNQPTVKYNKPTNYNSTIGSRAAYYAP